MNLNVEPNSLIILSLERATWRNLLGLSRRMSVERQGDA